MKLLGKRYREDNTEERAIIVIVTLKQADKQDFNVFYAKYQELQAYCPMSSDKQEIHRLQGKLNNRFRNKLADGIDCVTLTELVSRCSRLQTQWEAIDADTSRNTMRSESKDRRNKRTNGPSSASGTGASNASKTSSAGLPRRISLPESELPREFRNLPLLTNDLR